MFTFSLQVFKELHDVDAVFVCGLLNIVYETYRFLFLLLPIRHLNLFALAPFTRIVTLHRVFQQEESRGGYVGRSHTLAPPDNDLMSYIRPFDFAPPPKRLFHKIVYMDVGFRKMQRETLTVIVVFDLIGEHIAGVFPHIKSGIHVEMRHIPEHNAHKYVLAPENVYRHIFG